MHLTLFFTQNTSLRTWDRVGMLDREVALYRKYLDNGIEVTFVTYGHKDRKRYKTKLDGIQILCNEFRLPTSLYTKLIPFLHAKTLSRTSIIKSNQTPGALIALNAAHHHNKPMLARCGYMHSEFIAKEHGESSPQALEAREYERHLFSAASAIEVTTPMMRQDIEKRIPQALGKVNIVPNYVDTDIFTPKTTQKDIDLLFIGRLNPQKNLSALLDALHGLKLKTTIIGQGPLEEELKAKAQELQLDIDWTGNIANSELPNYLNRAKLFILPSHYEGHPKTLIEAMATGCPVIGANAPGIREVITDRSNGLLSPGDPESLKATIQALVNSATLQEKLGNEARAFALGHYSLDVIAEQELALIEQTIRNR